MFYNHYSKGKLVVLIVNVDDIILIGEDLEELERLKGLLAKKFEIKQLGSLRYLWGMKFARSKEGIFISQRKYTLDLRKETRLLGCKPDETPTDPICKLGLLKESKGVDKERYQ